MLKKLLESAIFVGILCQLYFLAQNLYNPADSHDVPAKTVAKAPQYTSPHQQAWLEMKNDAEPYARATTETTDPAAMRKMASAEAQRILQTGDVETLQKEMDKNQVWLKLMGYGY